MLPVLAKWCLLFDRIAIFVAVPRSRFLKPVFLCLAILIATLPFLQSGFIAYRKITVQKRFKTEQHETIRIKTDLKKWNHKEIDWNGHRYDVFSSVKVGDFLILDVVNDDHEGKLNHALIPDSKSSQKNNLKKQTIPDWNLDFLVEFQPAFFTCKKPFPDFNSETHSKNNTPVFQPPESVS